MNQPSARPLNITLCFLAALLLCFIAAAVFFGVTIGTIEHYMDIAPADWPYPGSFWDVANDMTCIAILLPSGWIIGRFAFWLVFCPVPFLIELSRRNWWMAFVYFACILLPTHIEILYGVAAFGNTVYLLVILFIFPMQLMTWSSLSAHPLEKKLIRANLIVLWLLYGIADIMLGLNLHSGYCKLSLIDPISQ
jgi:hypothetical protein